MRRQRDCSKQRNNMKPPEELSEMEIGKLPSGDQDNDHKNIPTWEENG